MVKLYKFKSLGDVHASASALPDLSNHNTEAMCRSLRRLLDEGTLKYKSNQREDAYFHLFRFFEMHKQLTARRDFKRDENRFYKIIGGKEKLKSTVTILEELAGILRKEYESLKPPAVKSSTNHPPSPPIKQEPSLREKISVNELKALRQKGQKDFLLCEVRDPGDYADNHVNWKESILIPPSIIRSDIIPQKLQELLPLEESRKAFGNRCNKDYIIFIDNHSKKVQESKSLENLRRILTAWEVSNVRHNIIICEGGFDKFSMAYPLDTTKKTKSSSGFRSFYPNSMDIKNLSYPEEEDIFRKKNCRSPSPPPSQHNSHSRSPAFSSGAISLSPTTTNTEPYSNGLPSGKPFEYPKVTPKPHIPDRSLKASIIKDPETTHVSKDVKVETKIEENDPTKEEIREEEKEKKESKVIEKPRALGRQSSTINRSYSSPNIAQLAEKEEDNLLPCGDIIPRIHVDRSTKPSSQIKRNFDHIWSSGQTKRGLTGLKNLGNTCYMNSMLQCISNFTVMAKYFLEKKYINDINKKSETHGNIANEYSALLQQMWSGNVKSISPSDMKRVIGRYNSSFSGSDQQDAHEFFLAFMLWLHNDVNEIQEKVSLPEQKTENAPSKKAAAKEAWDFELKVDKSFIRQTFYGQRKSTLQCLACNYESSRYDSFIELSLELPPGNRKVSLGECIKLYLDPVYVTWTCSKCKHNGRSLKKFDLVKLPLILTIHLARFFNDGLWRKKQNVVEFDLEHVDFGRYVTKSEEGTLNTLSDFSLYGVCNHFGSMEGGHYTAYCYSQVYSKWHKYDDNEVHEIDRSNVVTAAAYVLFYAAKN